MRGRAKALPRSFAILLCIVTALVFMPTLPGGQASAADVAINSTNFPDTTFRQYVQQNFDTNNNGYLSDTEIQNAKTISLGGSYNDYTVFQYHGVKNLKGIEYLTSLEKLNVQCGQLTKLPIENNKKLKYIDCGHNKLAKISLNNHTDLQELYCGYNELKDIYYSGSCDYNLVTLKCPENKLTSLFTWWMTNIKTLNISHNDLTDLDFGNQHAALQYLNVSFNKKLKTITDTSVGGPLLTNVKTLLATGCYSLTNDSLNTFIKQQSNLEGLYIDGCSKLTNLDLSFNPKLTRLKMGNHSDSFRTLNLRSNIALERIEITGMEFSTLNFSENTNVKKLELGNMPNLYSVTLGDMQDLRSLYLRTCPKLYKITLGSKPVLEAVIVTNTPIADNIVTSNLPKLNLGCQDICYTFESPERNSATT